MAPSLAELQPNFRDYRVCYFINKVYFNYLIILIHITSQIQAYVCVYIFWFNSRCRNDIIDFPVKKSLHLRH